MLTNVNNLQVLFEDNHLILVNKRSSDIVQGDKTGDTPLSEVVKLWLKKKYNKPGNVFLGVVHRIDRPVSGVVLFAKTSKALSRLSEAFRMKEIEKTYLAAVVSRPGNEGGQLTDFLIRDHKKNKSRVVKGKKNAKESKLKYKLIGASDNYFFLEVCPETGRHHQIRVQLAAMGCAIKGDIKYGAPRTNKNASIHLHAFKLEFVHPVTKQKLSFKAPLPEDPVWNAVKNLV